MPERPENNPAPSLQAPLNHDEREELEQLRVEVAYLKSCRPCSGKKHVKTRDKTQIVNELRPDFPLARLLKAAGLARSTFYWQLASGKNQTNMPMISGRF